MKCEVINSPRLNLKVWGHFGKGVHRENTQQSHSAHAACCDNAQAAESNPQVANDAGPYTSAETQHHLPKWLDVGWWACGLLSTCKCARKDYHFFSQVTLSRYNAQTDV